MKITVHISTGYVGCSRSEEVEVDDDDLDGMDDRRWFAYERQRMKPKRLEQRLFEAYQRNSGMEPTVTHHSTYNKSNQPDK